MSLSPRVARLEAAIPQLHQNIFQCLLAANAAKEVNAVLRVAGGWVRDALLGVPCHDIDIALESPPHAQISGEQFARAVAAYQAEQQPAARERTVSVIRVNPALSKHIETSTLCVCDLPVEFCALRTDDYTDESRIPQVRPATPKEDALRRDFTINALFYNLHTNLVEDYTSGLQDLQSRILRCPLDPAETFHDDPLRLLRGVRFIGQLGALNFRLDDAIPACVTEELLETLLVKVSRERIGKEFVKMLCCAAPSKCIDLLYSMQLLQNVLLAEVHMKTIPGKKKTSAEIDSIVPLVRTVADSSKALKVLRGLNSVITPLFTNPQFFSLQEEEQSSIVLVALLIPFMVGVPPSVSADRLYAVCVNSLKLPLSTYQAVRCMVDSVNALCDGNLSLDELTSPLGMSPQTILKHFEALGFLNDKHVPERAYEVVVLLYIALTACDHCGDGGLEMHVQHDIVQYWSQSWSVLKSHPLLLTAFSMPLPLKGNELKSVIPGLEAKDIGAILLSLRRKLVLHPEMDREAVVQWLQGDRAV